MAETSTVLIVESEEVSRETDCGPFEYWRVREKIADRVDTREEFLDVFQAARTPCFTLSIRSTAPRKGSAIWISSRYFLVLAERSYRG